MRGLLLSDLYDNRQNHRSAFRLLEQELADVVAHLILEVLDVDGPLFLTLDDVAHALAHLHQEVFLLLDVDEAAGNDVGARVTV